MSKVDYRKLIAETLDTEPPSFAEEVMHDMGSIHHGAALAALLHMRDGYWEQRWWEANGCDETSTIEAEIALVIKNLQAFAARFVACRKYLAEREALERAVACHDYDAASEAALNLHRLAKVDPASLASESALYAQCLIKEESA